VEERVLVALREKLMRKDLFEDFCREYVRELNSCGWSIALECRAPAASSPPSKGRYLQLWSGAA
jgi:hypothetical protein